MNRKITLSIVSILLMLITFVSCTSIQSTTVVAEESAVSEEIKTNMVKAFSKMRDTDVVSYRLRGEGPEGAGFDWIEVTTPNFAIGDIRRGSWTLYAQGLNRYGEVVISGKLDTFLSEDSPIDNLVLNVADGIGAVACNIVWNPSQVKKPIVEVYTKRIQDGEFVARPEREIVIDENGKAHWDVTSMMPGSYVVRFVLKDRSNVINGTAAALRVVDGMTSIGEVKMAIGTLQSGIGINLVDYPSNSFAFDIMSSENNSLYPSANLELEKYKEVTYEWYVNGNLVSTKEILNVADLSLENGYHNVDLIIFADDKGAVGSDNYTLKIGEEFV